MTVRNDGSRSMLSPISTAPALAPADQPAGLQPADAADVQQFDQIMGTADVSVNDDPAQIDAVFQNGIMVEGINEMCRLTQSLKDDFKS
jgi:hypothetical protein